MQKTALSLSLILLLSGCAQDPGKDKAVATVEEATPTPAEAPAAATPAVASGTQYKVDPSQSKLSSIGAKVTAEHPIIFHEYEASIGVDSGRVSSVNYTANMAKIEADHPRLTEHLLNEDFFWVEKFPTSTFRSTAIAEGSEATDATHTVTGDLTIRGQTKKVSFPATIALNDTQATANTEFVINRHDFGVTYKGRKDDLIKDNVLIQVSFVAPLSAN